MIGAGGEIASRPSGELLVGTRAKSGESRKSWKRIALALLGFALLLLVVKKTRYYFVWDNFAEVEPGVLYRSAHLHPYQLRSAVQKYGLHAVLNLGHHSEADEEEERVVSDLGIRYLKTNWPGNGLVSEEALRWAYDLVSDPANQPILVHCARGTHRTGVTVAYWRILRSDWTRDQIREEMVAHRFHPRTKPKLESLIDGLFEEHRKVGSAAGNPGPR
ncbi:MAG TPA: hypothetical protein VKF62_00695 [Planctomycetota bacterium]|nr:hypothetical protein [Planctomycetota bacterium]